MKQTELNQLEVDAKDTLDIISEINKLKENLECINQVDVVKFQTWNNEVIFKSTTGNLTDAMKTLYVQETQTKIKHLERKLQELWTK
ncbi:hypothetical protein ACTWQB_11440 [Piscibacillus sp. B03]|uniref:hypothetical protein n=1 Tax=Piscibacillus sp. B03 TaxID=3457430 RepID=UPI003FCD083F